MLALFSKLEANGRYTYVVAQHMAHDAHSELIAHLLNRESALPVIQAAQEQSLMADNVYLIPAGHDAHIDHDRLLLLPPKENTLSTPSVNILFESLAETARQRAIGILLSGAGRDGTTGCLAIKAAGGITIALPPETTKFNGMPSSAIDANAVSYILSIDMIADRLNCQFTEPNNSVVEATLGLPTHVTNTALAELLTLIFDATGIDFSGYKEETLLRRLDKRLSTLGLTSFDGYLNYIVRHGDELHTLQHLFLVSLSSFFRDRASFIELEKALKETLSLKHPGENIRIWVPGCASGEEVFTLAIIVLNLLGDRLSEQPLHIIGTDLNSEAIEAAQKGIYRQTAFREMPDSLRTRFFDEKGHHYQVTETLRSYCQFERQNVIESAPLMNLDLISCRNLLIYLKSPLQIKIIRSFHQALRPHGLLFVGQAESIGIPGNTLFYPVDHYHKIYRRRP